jgi:hypothetical protein
MDDKTKKYWVNLASISTATLAKDGTLSISLISREKLLFSGPQAQEIWTLLDASRKGLIFHV